MKGQKVLIFTASAGAGHVSCANAFKEAFLQRFPNGEVEIVDMYMLSKLTAGYPRLYSLIGKFYPFELIYNFFHRMIDRFSWFAKIASIVTVWPLFRPTMKLLNEYNPDIVVGNNTLLIPVLDKCRKEKEFKYIVTVTDIITVCRWWASPVADKVFVPTQEAEQTLKGYTPNCNIVRDYFSFREITPLSEQERVDLYKEFFSEASFSKDKPIILITGGGFSTREIVKNMTPLFLSPHYQFVILTGRDKKLYEGLNARFGDKNNILILGFTHRNLDLMAISDIVISKFGSVSVVEIEELNKKALFTRPVGYQEYGNIEYVKRNDNFVYIGRNLRYIREEIVDLFYNDLAPSTAHIKNAKDIITYIFSK